MEQQVIRPGRQQGLARWLLVGLWPSSARRQRCGRGTGAGALARRAGRLPGGDGGLRWLRADRAPRARGAGGAGRHRQPETGTRLRPRHGPGSQDRPGRRQGDRPLWRGPPAGAHAHRRPGARRAGRDPGLPPPADRRDHRAPAAARASAQPGHARAGRQGAGLPPPGGEGARPSSCGGRSRRIGPLPPTSPS